MNDGGVHNNHEGSLADAVKALEAGTLSRDEFLTVFQATEVVVPVERVAHNETRFAVFRYGNHMCGATFSTTDRVPPELNDREMAVLNGESLAKLWPSDLVLSLDPTDSAPGLLIPGAEVQRMASDSLDRVVPSGERMLVGAPASEAPYALRQIAADLVVTFSEISRAYLFQMAIGNDSQLVLGVVLDPSAQSELVMPRAARWVTERAVGLGPIDLLPLDESLRRSVEQFVDPVSAP